MRKMMVLSIGILLFQLVLNAQEYHVATTGHDSNPGTLEAPFLTISAAAKVAYAGDEIIVHGGIYREQIIPPRGGESESKRIIYRAAKNEKVIVKGSEQIVTWVPDGQNVWKVELPNSFFGDYNPYYLKINGPWLYYGQWYHRGSVYYDGKAYSEKQSLEDVLQKKAVGTWYSNIDKDKTTIWAHFPQGNSPNISKLAEINVRETIFFPEISGLKYITVDGFHFMHSAENWASPRDNLQMGAVGIRMGKHWIIENCTISDARCSGISLGKAPGDFDNIDDFGDHIIRNNIIQRCGQAGIIGAYGATRCKISNNLIEEINSRKEFGGFETAGIKFHHSIDTDISGNLIRGVYRKSHSAWGIWIDYANQGTRISKNIIYNTDIECLFLEINPGGMLVDHNIFIGSGILTSSGETAFVHNLIVDGVSTYRDDNFRSSSYYKPHTRRVLGKKAGSLKHNKWFNNMFVKQGLDSISKQDGYEVDYNVFLEKAKKNNFDDRHSLVDSSFTSGFTLKEDPLGVTITFDMDQKFLKKKHPLIDGKFIGVFPVTGQTIEDRDGNPITVNTDINGRMFTKPIPGPISDLKDGTNIFKWNYKKTE
jgi:alpha-N-arabinofuranosidase